MIMPVDLNIFKVFFNEEHYVLMLPGELCGSGSSVFNYFKTQGSQHKYCIISSSCSSSHSSKRNGNSNSRNSNRNE